MTNFKEKTMKERQDLYKRKEVLEEELKQLLIMCRKKRDEIEEIKRQISQKFAILRRVEKKS